MHREILHEPYSIIVSTLDASPHPAHQHSFFELVYIIEGSGLQCINQSQFGYEAGHLFLITPEDCHSFDVQTTTTFFFLRFNNIYQREGGLLPDNIRNLEFILQNANHRPGCLLKNRRDKVFARPLVEAIVTEMQNGDIYGRQLIQQLVNTLITLVTRNIARYHQLDISDHTDARAMDILHYIQSHIYEPEKLRTEHISTRFNLSPAYLGRYFKQHTHETMQQYILNYKLKLIEHRLKFSNKRLNEIAHEFNFTDESHFSKFFKKQTGHSPKAYRALHPVQSAA